MIIKEADKGSSVVNMNKLDYREMTLNGLAIIQVFIVDKQPT